MSSKSVRQLRLQLVKTMMVAMVVMVTLVEEPGVRTEVDIMVAAMDRMVRMTSIMMGAMVLL